MKNENRRWSLLRIITVILFTIALIGIGFLTTVYLLYKNIERSITIELGTALPPATIFCTDGRDATYNDPPEISMTEEGDYSLTVCTGIWKRKVTLYVRDTQAPKVTTENRIISVTESLSTSDLITSVEDPSPVTISWKNEPQFGFVGEYCSEILVEDCFGHETVATANVIIVESNSEITIEAGSSIPDVSEFLKTPDGLATCPELADIDSTLPGSYSLNVEYHGITYPASLFILDTTAPTATVINCETHTGYPLSVDQFITDIVDVTEVSVSFKEEPDWSGDGQITVTVCLTDTSNNSTELQAQCTLIKENEAPQLWGVTDRYCYVDEAVAYLQNIYVTDNYDAPEDVTISVDKSAVNTHSVGDYKVTYTATDHSGNTTSKSCIFHFIQPTVSEEELNAIADRILSEILTDDMTVTEQAYAIFVYIYDHIYYSDETNITDWQLAAYKGFTKGRGDCYTYFSCSYVLLNKIDCQVIPIKRARNYLHHFWCLVNVGNGWYHFDPTNFNTDKIPPHWAFMRTTKELYSMTSGTYFWNFDASLYPEIATTKFVAPD